MPYTHKKVGNKQCVYNKNTGKKVGCTAGPIKKYLAALHANVPDSKKEEIKKHIKNIIKELLKEDANPILFTKEVSDTLDHVLNSNVGLPFDNKEKEAIIVKQSKMGINGLITKNGTEVKFSSTNEFGNNNINVIKKLKNMSDPSTLIYASFFTNVPQEKPESQPKTPEQGQEKAAQEKKVFIKMSQPFEDKDLSKLNILGHLLNKLDL